jgi:hypothetical protein
MLRLWQIVIVAVVAGAASLGSPRALAQDQGVAVITSPLPGAIASGVVPILGTATHGQFERYELAFSYSADPTDTWFVIAVGETPVANEVLARWDTAGVSDGTYTLRLRVFGAGGSLLEATVPDVRLANATPTAPPSLPDATPTPPVPTEAIIELPPTATPRPSATPAPVADPNERPSGPGMLEDRQFSAATVSRAFVAGVRLTLIGFLLLAAYASLRAVVRLGLRR